MEYINSEQAEQYQKQCFYFFKDRQLKLIDKPAKSQNRQCTDTCCMFVFFAFLFGFVGYAIYSINLMFQKGLTKLSPNDQVTFLKQISQEQFYRVGIVVGSCVGGAVLIAIIVLILLKIIPQVMVYGMSFAPFAFLLTIIFFESIKIKSGGTSYFIVITFMYLGFMIGYCDNLSKAAILMKTAGMFIMENLKILLVLFFALLYCLLVLFFWIAGFYSFCVLYSHDQLSYGGFVVSFVFWAFMLVFFNFYFYYTSVFLTSTSLAIWFYDKTDVFDIVVAPFKLMVRYHLGTITYASLIITFSKILKFMCFLGRAKKSECGPLHLVGSFFACFICCFLGALQAIVEVINNYSIIICGLTGFGLIESGQIVGEFIFNDPNNVFGDFTISTYFVNSGGILMVTMIPTLVGGLLLSNLTGALWTLSVVLIFFLSSMIGLLVLQIFVESISTLFMLYSLDGRLAKDGLEVVWVDKFVKQLQKGFDEAFVGKLERKKIKTKSITTIVIHDNGVVQQFQNQVVVEEINNHNLNVTDAELTVKIEQNARFQSQYIPH